MTELNAILDAFDRGAVEDAVLATVVHVRGSAYRRPGARMLLFPDGRRIGSISGGCLEGDLCRKAWWFTAGHRASLRVYDTTSDDDAVWEFGLGCNGVIEVLLERATMPSSAEALRFLNCIRRSGGEAAIATVVRAAPESPVRIADRLFLDSEGKCSGSLAGSRRGRDIADHAKAAMRDRSSRLTHLPDCDLFVEWVGRPQSLVVFGAGHDAVPVTAIAAGLGWRVTVADGRPAYARRERFPAAERVVVLRGAERAADLGVDSDTAVVMMTHNYPLDAKLLPEILPLRPRYLGLLGPRQRAERLFEEIGHDMDRYDVHAPVGLDIGCDSPESIALSIVAGVQASLAGRAGGELRLRSGPIHSAVREIGERPFASADKPELISCEVGTGNHA